ncbi:MAG: hypothetical protein KKA28_02135 [Planctomycetes bacterium]|nr:hypothetical protein [Planctomycetota bacterium]MCG2683347.1 hypothetical protein [Planctomycetales bacterium]
MTKTLAVLGMALVVTLVVAGPAFCELSLPYGSATVDGDLSDWADASWNSLDAVYDSYPIDIAGGAWAARWTADKVYMAVKVQDTDHIFSDSNTGWGLSDALELTIHTTGSTGDYPQYFEPAQQWTVGITTALDGSVWATAGYPDVYGAYTPTVSQFQAVGSVNGEWLYYEAAITPFEYFGSKIGEDDVMSPLSAGMTIGLDCTAVGNDGVSTNEYEIPGYTGMKCSDLDQTIGGWSENYYLISQHLLVPEPGAGLLAVLGAGIMVLAGFAVKRRKA